MISWVLFDAATSQYMGRVLARDEAGALKLGGEFWPKVKEFTVRTAEEEDDPFS